MNHNRLKVTYSAAKTKNLKATNPKAHCGSPGWLNVQEAPRADAWATMNPHSGLV